MDLAWTTRATASRRSPARGAVEVGQRAGVALEAQGDPLDDHQGVGGRERSRVVEHLLDQRVEDPGGQQRQATCPLGQGTPSGCAGSATRGRGAATSSMATAWQLRPSRSHGSPPAPSHNGSRVADGSLTPGPQGDDVPASVTDRHEHPRSPLDAAAPWRDHRHRADEREPRSCAAAASARRLRATMAELAAARRPGLLGDGRRTGGGALAARPGRRRHRPPGAHAAAADYCS